MEYFKYLMLAYLISIYFHMKITNWEGYNDEEMLKSLNIDLNKEDPIFYRASSFVPFINTALCIEWVWSWFGSRCKAKNMKNK